jgi:hypothetical protein
MENLTDTLITAALAAAPGIVIGVWAWFKARSAETAAQWDDASVKFVEDIAKRISGQQ